MKLLQSSLAAKDEAELPLNERSEEEEVEEEEAPSRCHHQPDYTSVPASTSPLSSTPRSSAQTETRLATLSQPRGIYELVTTAGEPKGELTPTAGGGHRTRRMTGHMSLTLSYFAMFGLHTPYLAHGSLSQFYKPGSHQRRMTTL